MNDRMAGGRHRQDVEDPPFEDIPAPRRTERCGGASTDRFPAVVEPPRRGRTAAPEPAEPLDGDENRDGWADEDWADEDWTDEEPALDEPDEPAAGPEPEPDEPAAAARGAAAPESRRRRRRRAVPAGRGVLRRIGRLGWIAIGIVVLAGIGVAIAFAVPGLLRESPAQIPVPAVAPAPVEAAFGERVGRGDGWTVAIAAPRGLKDADDVTLPRTADRGLVFDVTLTNDTAEPRDSAGWQVKAVVGSSPVDLLPDGAAPSRTIRPGSSLTFPVTVPLPDATSDVQLEAEPIGGAPSLFVGTL